MDIFLIVKSLLIGIVWGGSFLWILSVGVHIFPLPGLINLRRTLLDFALRRYEKKPSAGEWWWRIFVIGFKGCAILMWVAALAFFAYTSIEWMRYYLPKAIHGTGAFWIYYTLEVAPTAILILVWGVRFFILGKRTEQIPTLPEEDDRPLVEQMVD